MWGHTWYDHQGNSSTRTAPEEHEHAFESAGTTDIQETLKIDNLRWIGPWQRAGANARLDPCRTIEVSTAPQTAALLEVPPIFRG